MVWSVEGIQRSLSLADVRVLGNVHTWVIEWRLLEWWVLEGGGVLEGDGDGGVLEGGGWWGVRGWWVLEGGGGG